MAADIYRPELWHDFFVMVGGGAAALTGLVFVAMPLNIDVIAQDATHRYRAIGTFAGFTAAFMTCALVLLGSQGHVAVGYEWLAVAILSAVLYVNGIYNPAKYCSAHATEALNQRRRSSPHPLRFSVCEHCGEDFETRNPGRRYCSDGCRMAAFARRSRSSRLSSSQYSSLSSSQTRHSQRGGTTCCSGSCS
jgi:hypothetical protein